MGINKHKQALGENPLSKSIFTPTSQTEDLEVKNQESRKKKEESRIKNQEKERPAKFLADSSREKVNFRLPTELNDWLDDLIKSGKRKHGQKIPKEVWVQAALEIMKGLPINWSEVASVDELRAELESTLARIVDSM